MGGKTSGALVAWGLVVWGCSSSAPNEVPTPPGSPEGDAAVADGAVATPPPDASTDAEPLPAADIEVLATELGGAMAVAVEGERLFFDDVTTSTILTCDVGNCRDTLAPYTSDASLMPDGMRAHAGWLHWITATGLYRCRVEGCSSPERLAALAGARSLTVEDSAVYVGERDTNRILRVVPGEEPVVVAEGTNDARQLDVAEGQIYFGMYGVPPAESGVFRVPANGTTSAPVRLDGQHAKLGVFGVDATSAQLTWAEVGAVRQCPASGCVAVPTTLLASQESFELLRVHGEFVVVVTFGGHLYVCKMQECVDTLKDFELESIARGMAVSDTGVYVVATAQPNDGRLVHVRVPKAQR